MELAFNHSKSFKQVVQDASFNGVENLLNDTVSWLWNACK